MKYSIKVKNKFIFPSYTVMLGKQVIQGFYSKAEAIKLRNKLNKLK